MTTLRLFILILFTTLTSCSSIDVSDYQGSNPKLVMESFFDGPLVAHGMIKNRSGKVTRRFTATIAASWNGNTGILDEDFIFDDGEKQKRIWTLTKQTEGHYTGKAGDVIGEANIKTAGNAAFLNYTLQIDYKGKPMEIVVDDRMYLISPDVMLNESNLIKYGINVGSITLVIRKLAN